MPIVVRLGTWMKAVIGPAAEASNHVLSFEALHYTSRVRDALDLGGIAVIYM